MVPDRSWTERPVVREDAQVATHPAVELPDTYIRFESAPDAGTTIERVVHGGITIETNRLSRKDARRKYERLLARRWEHKLNLTDGSYVLTPKPTEVVGTPPIVTSSELVNDVQKFIGRYVIMDPYELLLVTVWTLHTYLFEIFEQTPYLSVMSPQKRCAKTRLLEVLSLLVAGSARTANMSVAAMYRLIETAKPTLLIDEIDAVFNPRMKSEKNEELRGILNAGNRRGSHVLRCSGPNHNVEKFDVFCPKVLAGIGQPPETVADRSIPTHLKRKKKAEKVERLTGRKARPLAQPIGEAIERWTAERRDAIAARYDEESSPVPDELNDRMVEAVEPLVVIADELGVGAELRMALLKVITPDELEEKTWQARMLRDVKAVWDALEPDAPERTAGRIHSADLVAKLLSLDESPWNDYYGHVIEQRDVSSLLRHYDIESSQGKVGGINKKGYRLADLQDAWDRYL